MDLRDVFYHQFERIYHRRVRKQEFNRGIQRVNVASPFDGVVVALLCVDVTKFL